MIGILRNNGPGATGINFAALAKPAVSPKIIIASCTSLKDKLTSQRNLLYLIKNGRSFIETTARNSGYKLVGNEADSFSMIEMFGLAFPASWNLIDDEAKPFVFLALQGMVPAALADATTFDDITDDMWTAINGTFDHARESSNFESVWSSLLATTVYSLCRQGSHSMKSANDLSTELSTNHGYAITISSMGSTGYWNTLGKTYSRDSIAAVMKWILPHLKGSIRLENLVKFSKEKGLTVYHQVKTALGTYPDFNWSLVHACARQDFINYTAARTLVKDRPYFGYNADIGIAAASNYPTLGYVSIELNKVVGGQTTLASLNNRIMSMVNKERWNKIVRAYRDNIESAVFSEAQQEEADESFKTIKDALYRPFDDDSRRPPGPEDHPGGPAKKRPRPPPDVPMSGPSPRATDHGQIPPNPAHVGYRPVAPPNMADMRTRLHILSQLGESPDAIITQEMVDEFNHLKRLTGHDAGTLEIREPMHIGETPVIDVEVEPVESVFPPVSPELSEHHPDLPIDSEDSEDETNVLSPASKMGYQDPGYISELFLHQDPAIDISAGREMFHHDPAKLRNTIRHNSAYLNQMTDRYFEFIDSRNITSQNVIQTVDEIPDKCPDVLGKTASGQYMERGLYTQLRGNEKGLVGYNRIASFIAWCKKEDQYIKLDEETTIAASVLFSSVVLPQLSPQMLELLARSTWRYSVALAETND